MSQVQILSPRPLICKGFSPASRRNGRLGSQAVCDWVTDWVTSSSPKSMGRSRYSDVLVFPASPRRIRGKKGRRLVSAVPVRRIEDETWYVGLAFAVGSGSSFVRTLKLRS